MKIKFIDLTKHSKSPSEQLLSLDEMQDIIFFKSNRRVFFNQSRNFDLSKIAITYDNYVGFSVIADKDITKGEELFSYGGEIIPEADHSNDDYEYALPANTGKEKIIFQGKSHGDIGTLLTCLPDEEFLKDLQIKDLENKIQRANLLHYYKDGEVYFSSSTDVKKGTVLGFCYGMLYWLKDTISPKFFKSNSYQILPERQIKYIPMLRVYNDQNDVQMKTIQNDLPKTTIGISLLTLFINFDKNPDLKSFIFKSSLAFMEISKEKFTEFMKTNPERKWRPIMKISANISDND